MERVPPGQATSLEEARKAIFHLFEAGRLDEDAATAALLALDLGLRRAAPPANPARSRSSSDSSPRWPRQ